LDILAFWILIVVSGQRVFLAGFRVTDCGVRPAVAVEISIARLAQMPELEAVAQDQGFLLGAGPAFELGLAPYCVLECHWTFVENQSRPFVVVCVFAAETEPMLAQAFAQIARMPDII
jgi:hypothetical protein